MKKRHFIIINIIFVGLIGFSATMVYQFMTGSQPWSLLTQFQSHKPTVTVTDRCSEKPPLTQLNSLHDSSLQKLAVYQQACRSFVTDTVMVFFSIPTTAEQGIDYAEEDAKVLKAFAKAGIRPLVIAEPAMKDGTMIDYQLLANGTYDSAFDAYFNELKQQGLTTKQLGIWNPFPEINLPYWKNNLPEYFAPAVNHYLTVARNHFAKVQTSLLLNSATYETTDFNWENGDYNSLLPYVKGVKPGLITYAGLQGFPWVARQGGEGRIFNAAEFLNPSLLTEMAESLGTKKVWFNTGTFSSKYTLDADKIRHISSSQRKEILLTIKEQAFLLKEKGYNVSVNIFAEDKSEQTEETDWSYWPGQQPFASADTLLLTDFIRDLNSEKVAFWLFDR